MPGGNTIRLPSRHDYLLRFRKQNELLCATAGSSSSGTRSIGFLNLNSPVARGGSAG